MFKLSLIIDGIISFFVGGLIFLVGIGAILGCAGGLLLLLLGGLIIVFGMIAFGDLIKIQDKPAKQANPKPGDIQLTKRNGKWVIG